MCDEMIKECFFRHAGEDKKLCMREVPGMIKELMEAKGCKPQDMQCQGQKKNPMQMFKEWDTDGDRMLSWEEFEAGPLKKMKEVMECNK